MHHVTGQFQIIHNDQLLGVLANEPYDLWLDGGTSEASTDAQGYYSVYVADNAYLSLNHGFPQTGDSLFAVDSSTTVIGYVTEDLVRNIAFDYIHYYGHVTDVNGDPIADALITGAGLDSVYTDAEGYYELRNPAWYEEPIYAYAEGFDFSDTPGWGTAYLHMSTQQRNFVGTLVVSVASLAVPEVFSMDQNYPNPFNPSTTIRYGLPETAQVTLVVYDIQGHVVTELVQGSQAAGWYDLKWNGLNQDGQLVGTGVYLARIQAGEFTQTIKMLYLR